MPDMYLSPWLETILFDVIKNEDGSYDTVLSNRKPVAGTIARGYMPYAYPNTIEGYEAAGANLRNPFSKSVVNLKEGEVLYGKYCSACHGAGGEGDGLVGGKLPGAPPSYKTVLKTLPEGKIFHSITYGKNLMGQHASQVTKEERWLVIHYINDLIKKATPAANTTASNDTIKK